MTIDVKRIHVLADLHLGAPMLSKLNRWKIPVASALTRMESPQTSALAIAGDLFDKARPRTRWYAAAIELVDEIQAAGFAAVVLLCGNHDVDEKSREHATDAPDNALDVLAAAFRSNCRVLVPTGPDATSLSLDGEPVGLLPHPYRNLEAFGGVEPSIVLAHFAPEGGAAGSNYVIERGVNLSEAFGKDDVPRLVVAGDLHAHQAIQVGLTTCFVPGSPYPVRMADVRGLRRYLTVRGPSHVTSHFIPTQWTVLDALVRLDGVDPVQWSEVLESTKTSIETPLLVEAEAAGIDAPCVLWNLTLAVSATHLEDADAFVASLQNLRDTERVTVTAQDLLDAVAPADDVASETCMVDREETRAPLTTEERLNGYLSSKVHEPDVLDAAKAFVAEMLDGSAPE